MFIFLHVTFFVISYLFFGAACVSSFLFLYQEKKIKNKKRALTNNRIPSLGVLLAFSFRLTLAGFYFLTAGVITSVCHQVQQSAEITQISMRLGLPLILWFIYALLIGDLVVKGHKGGIISKGSITGFSLAAVSCLYELSLI